MTTGRVRVFGVRHHGPGCARALRTELERWRPDAVLVEGPPDADDALRWLAEPTMEPPVALLVYADKEPGRAVVYPFTTWSPEWQALAWAAAEGVTARFIDLPMRYQLAHGYARGDHVAGATRRDESLELVAHAAGAPSWERWWDEAVEQRQDTEGLFDALVTLMAELRGADDPLSPHEARREAWMRTTIRDALRDGHDRVAVVCGAWHAPALIDRPSASADARTLRGLRRRKVVTTWIPWTHSRLALRSGYGAGVESPGWNAHLWATPAEAPLHWMTRAARLLRDAGLDAPAASVIEAVRLSDALSALRGRVHPSLDEVHDAIQAVLCHGDPAPMGLVRRELEVGDVMGAVPPDAPAVPLQDDVARLQRRLRLKPGPDPKDLDLDLRTPNGRDRSQLLHRLVAIDVPWGTPQPARRSRGTFHELWSIQWEPDFAVRLVEANARWGHTLEAAATACLRARGDAATTLDRVAALLGSALVADLPDALTHLLHVLADRASAATECRELMDAVPPLVRVARYGDVRGTTRDQLLPVIDGLFERALVHLPGACTGLDDEAAATLVESLDAFARAVLLLDDDDRRARLVEVLRQVASEARTRGLPSGFATRLLLEQQALAPGALERRAGRALSAATPPEQAAAWLEGLLRGSALVVLYEDGLWRVLDAWLAGLDEARFRLALPVLRRAFSTFEPAARRRIGRKLRALHAPATPATTTATALDHDRAARVLPVLRTLVGPPPEATP